MASKDVKRLNPGIQVNLLYVGAGTKVNPHLVPETSNAAVSGMLGSDIGTLGASPTTAFALNSSGSVVVLTPA